MKHITTLVIAIFFASTLFCQTIYVTQTGTGDGSSWQQATDLQNALEISSFGREIWVAEGIYKPTFCSTCGFTERNTSFAVKDGVKLLGGFNGTETQSDQRSATQNLTILSGDIDNDNTLANNSYSVLFTIRVSDQTLIDGFTIQDGNADFVGNTSTFGERLHNGAGFFNNGQQQGQSSHPVVRNCTFTNNYAVGFGGAVYSDGSFEGNASPTFENVKFINNTAKDSGGGFYGNGTFRGGISDPVFRSCEFIGNQALEKDGGAMVNAGGAEGFSNPLIEDCRFESNKAYLEGGAVYNSGRQNGHGNPTFIKTVFIKNEAHLGGAVFSDGFIGETNPRFIDCDFLENQAISLMIPDADTIKIEIGDGGAVYNLGSSGGSSLAKFERCNFENNRSTASGAAVLNNGSSGTCDPEFINCEFKQNVAEKFGAAMYNIGNAGHCNPKIYNCLFVKNRGFSAGAIYNLGSDGGNSSPFITNCTFVGNRAEVGGAIYCNANDEEGISAPTISNCVFYDNYAPTGEVFRIIFGFPKIEHSSFDLDSCDDFTDHISSNVNCGDGLVFSDEVYFVDTLAGDYRLKEGTSIIGQGNNMATMEADIQVDLDGNPRIINNVVDYGAYEFQGNMSMPPAITGQPESKDVCENEAVIFAIVAASNEAMTYQWKKDGSPIAGAIQSMYQISSANLQDAGNYSCEVTNSVGTAESTAATLVVEELVEFSVDLTAPSTVCEGAEVQVSANLSNGGDTPKIMWFLNSNPLGTIEDSVIVSGIFGVGTVSCIAITSLECVVEETKFDSVDITSVPFVTPELQLMGPDTVVCEGQLARFETSFSNGGQSPIFEWTKNNFPTSVSTDFYEATDLEDGDSIQCFMTSSEECPTLNPVFSDQVSVSVDTCNFVSTLDIEENYHISLYPNPVSEQVNFELEGFRGEVTVTIFNVQGSELDSKIVVVNSDTKDFFNVNLPNFPSGTYFMNFKNEKKSATLLFVKK